MNRILLKYLLLIHVLFGGTIVFSQNSQLLMVVPPDKFHDSEYFDPMIALNAANVDVTIASLKTGKIGGVKADTIISELLISDVEVTEYDGICIMGGKGTGQYLWKNNKLNSLISDFQKNKKLVSAICAGSVSLARAGVLKNIKATTYPVKGFIKQLEENGALYSADSVVVDGNIVTANGPVGAKSFGEVLVRQLDQLKTKNTLKSKQAKEQNKPNIIFILADDLSYRDLSCYGQRRYETPNLDTLAVNGVRFTQAYAASSECAPSRGCLMTGLHTGHGPIRRNSSARGQDNLKDKDITIAEVLKKAGYNTGFTGKWGIGLPGTEGVPYKQGFDYCFGYYDQTRAHTFIPNYLWENNRKIEYPENAGFDMAKRYDYKNNKPINTYDENGKLYIKELKDPYGYTYSQDEIEKAAFQFLDKNDPQKTNEPFFLYYATHLPHGPVIIDDIGELAVPDSIMQLSREWGAMVKRIDSFVGELINHLKESGNYENTIIFFASDNGYSMCGYTDRGNMPNWTDDPWLNNKGPFRGGKFTVMEGGIRVPFFVSWPAKYQPAVLSEVVWLPDFFPTATALAGLDETEFDTDGANLIPLFEGRIDEFKKHHHLYFARDREQAIVKGSWKAYRKNSKSKTELYLINEDSYSERNMAHFYPQIVKEAEKLMDNGFTPTEWYWDPSDSREQFNLKKQKAIETDNILPVNRPNDMDLFPWEKRK